MQSRHENGTGGVVIGGGGGNGGKCDGSDGGDGDVDAADGTQPERVWLVHRGGFTAALRLPRHQQLQQEEHKLSVRLLHNGEQLTVDEDDIEKQNSPALDLAEDICELKYLNEASVLHCLRQRYASNLIHTKAGPTLLVVNPMAPLSLYSEKVRRRQIQRRSRVGRLVWFVACLILVLHLILICFVSFRVIYLAVSLSVSIRRLFPCSAAAKPRICRPTSTRWHRPPTGVWLKRDAIKVSFSWVVLVLARRQALSMLSTISRWLQVCLASYSSSSSSSPLSATTVHCGLTSFVQFAIRCSISSFAFSSYQFVMPFLIVILAILYYKTIIYDVDLPYIHNLINNCYQTRSSGGLQL